MTKKTILVADDDPALVQIVSKRCEALGLNVKRAYNSFNALAIIRGEKPDLVCCDVNMPDGNGLAACEILSTNSKWSWIPIIVLTGREDAGTIKKCHELGAYYVLKGDNVWWRARAADPRDPRNRSGKVVRGRNSDCRPHARSSGRAFSKVVAEKGPAKTIEDADRHRPRHRSSAAGR